MKSSVSGKITDNLSVPTLGIGAGRYCSGQILVADDVLGKYTDFTPKFARKYADIYSITENAIKQYIEDVESCNFPQNTESFELDNEEIEKLNGYSYSQNK